MGNYDIEVFETYRELGAEYYYWLGVYCTLTFVLLNALILINVVISMMASTYGNMTYVRKGLYNYNIIKTTYSYKLDSRYGGLIVLMPPFCVISFLLQPFYWKIKDQKKLKKFNKGFYLFVYSFIFIPIGAIFITVNIIMMPFAYFKICFKKIQLLNAGTITFIDCVFYFAAGLPLLLASQVTDFWAFMKS